MPLCVRVIWGWGVGYAIENVLQFWALVGGRLRFARGVVKHQCVSVCLGVGQPNQPRMVSASPASYRATHRAVLASAMPCYAATRRAVLTCARLLPGDQVRAAPRKARPARTAQTRWHAHAVCLCVRMSSTDLLSAVHLAQYA
eukprot:3933654-Rhodomonas_salina.4